MSTDGGPHPRVGIGVIVLRDDKILIGKRRGSHGAGRWALPGGHLEWGESFEDCARRELFEETGLSLTDLAFAYATNDVMPDEGKHYVTIFVTARASGEVALKEPHKCERWEWARWDELPEPRFLPLENLLRAGYRPW
jgi:8-oxo-dGTP diphosphatase